jgi:hypothetical protein
MRIRFHFDQTHPVARAGPSDTDEDENKFDKSVGSVVGNAIAELPG